MTSIRTLTQIDDDIQEEIINITQSKISDLQSRIDELVYEASMEIRVETLDYINTTYGEKLESMMEDDHDIDGLIDDELRNELHI